jgi:hypothetical protein
LLIFSSVVSSSSLNLLLLSSFFRFHALLIHFYRSSIWKFVKESFLKKFFTLIIFHYLYFYDVH